jgi:Ca2+-transporting ATPase
MEMEPIEKEKKDNKDRKHKKDRKEKGKQSDTEEATVDLEHGRIIDEDEDEMKRKDTFIGALEEFQPKTYKVTEEEKARYRAKRQAKRDRMERKRALRRAKKKGQAEGVSMERKVTDNTRFKVTPHEMVELVDFDKREDAKHVMMIKEKGGLEGLAGLLQTDLKTGLDTSRETEKFRERQYWFGRNFIEPPPPMPLWKMVWENLQDRILQILLAGAAINLVLGMIFEGPAQGWLEGVAIFVAVAIVVFVTSGNNYLKERKFRAIMLLQGQRMVKVRRDGKILQILNSDVLVGDIVQLESGDEIPADGLFIEGNRFAVDESPLTGETIPVKKSELRPFVFAGTQVAEGSGTVLVTTVGALSTGGQIQALLNEQRKDGTPLQDKLEVLAKQIGFVGVLAGLITFFALDLRWIIVTATTDDFFSWGSFEEVVHAFVLGVTLVVVAVPEGLPLAVTISLAYSMSKMIKDKNFVRHLAASETMGEATAICSDKTGTLTENRMTVTKAFVGGIEDPTSQTLPKLAAEVLLEGISVNSTAHVQKIDSPTPVFVGNKTEGALLVYAHKLGCEYDTIRKSRNKIGEIPFSSARKRMSTIIVTADGARVYTKGASEIVLGLCSSMITPQGEVVPLDPDTRAKYEQMIISYASQGLRTLTLGYRQVSGVPKFGEPEEEKALEQELTFIAVVGIKDPVRKEVPDAVKICQRAGLKVRMVTGDNILTAKHIATECGILTPDGVALEGPEFRKMDEPTRDAILPKLAVLARSSPQDKFILVSRLRKLGDVVAVTGDGTNDGPALKEADVGFAMGIAGTDVAKNASDIILLDDNFSSIVKAILWGRNVYDCIRKFLQFQLGVNIVAIVVTVVSALITGEAALSAVQLLWVNLIMDTFGALALATDSPLPSILFRPPHRRDESIVSVEMLIYMGGQAIYQMIVLLFILFYGYHWFSDTHDEVRIHTYVFTTFILLQVANMLQARVLGGQINFVRDLHKNPYFIPLMVIIIGVQILFVTFVGAFVSTRSLHIAEWLICFAFVLPNFLWGLLLRFFIRKYENRRVRREAIYAEITLEEIEQKAANALRNTSKARTEAGWNKFRTAVFFMSRYNKAHKSHEEEQKHLLNRRDDLLLGPLPPERKASKPAAERKVSKAEEPKISPKGTASSSAADVPKEKPKEWEFGAEQPAQPPAAAEEQAPEKKEKKKHKKKHRKERAGDEVTAETTSS